MSPSRRSDVWANGVDYEPYVGRWSRLVAREFLDWLALPADSAWLDIGCGTGALSQAILQIAAPRDLTGIDRSADYIAYLRSQIDDRRARFEVGDAQALPVDTSTCDAVVSGLVLNFIPQPQQAVNEMARAARSGGTVALYVWAYAGRMQMMRHF